MAEMLTAWLSIAVLYILSAIYVHLRYNGHVSPYLSVSMFSIGAAIFVAVNRWWMFDPALVHPWPEYVALGLALIAWGAMVLTAKAQIALYRRVGRAGQQS